MPGYVGTGRFELLLDPWIEDNLDSAKRKQQLIKPKNKRSESMVIRLLRKKCCCTRLAPYHVTLRMTK